MIKTTTRLLAAAALACALMPANAIAAPTASPAPNVAHASWARNANI